MCSVIEANMAIICGPFQHFPFFKPWLIKLLKCSELTNPKVQGILYMDIVTLVWQYLWRAALR